MATQRHAVRGKAGRFSTRVEKRGTFYDSLTPGIAAYGGVVIARVHQVMREWGRQAENRMRANAPWEDRTGDARDGLGWSLDESLTAPTVYLFHSVSYGVWLEVRWSGKYAIIVPTIEEFGPELIRMLEEVI